MSLFDELKRRSVFRVAIGYIGVSWLVIQVIETLFSIYGVDESIAQVIVTVLAIGFAPAMILAWVFELTPEGIKRDSETDREAPAMRDFGRRVDRIIIAILSVAVIYFAAEKFWPEGAVGPSIAVIPFENASGKPDQDAFANGMTKQMRSMLTSVRSLRVIADYSVTTLIEAGASRNVMAAELKLTHFLEGSIQTVGNRVRVTAELINVRQGAQVWSNVFDRELDNIFMIQDEIAAQVLTQMDFGAATPDPPMSQKIDIEAFKRFVRAEQLVHFRKGGESGPEERYREAVSLLEGVIEAEAEFVDGWLLLALARYRLFDPQAENPDMDVLQAADEALERARRLDPNHPVVLSYLATTSFLEGGDTQEIASMFEKAIEAAPTSGDVIRPARQFVMSIGRVDKALAMGELAVDRDPKCASCWYALSQTLRDDGRHKEAEDAAEVALALGMPLEFSIATTRLYQHEPEPMLALLENKPIQNAQDAWALSLALYTAGRESDFDEIFRVLREDFFRENGEHRAPLEVAMVFAWSGHIDEAFEWLDMAENQGPWVLQKSIRSPFFFNLRGDPRWNEMLRRIERHPEQLAKIEFDPEIPAVSR